MIAIVDLGLGNLFSVDQAVHYSGGKSVITDDCEVIRKAERIILPGVGSYRFGMCAISNKGLYGCLKDSIDSGTPVLGICLGMQLLMDSSEEHGYCRGLGIIPGRSIHFRNRVDFDSDCKVPHIGWNGLFKNVDGGQWHDSILADVNEGDSCYFAHSYCVVPDKQEHILSLSRYGGCSYASSVKHKNVTGCQFHPEKSGIIGLKIIDNFISGNSKGADK